MCRAAKNSSPSKGTPGPFSALCSARTASGLLAGPGSGSKTIKLWDATSGQEVLAIREGIFVVQSVAFSPDGRRIVCGSKDKTIKVWDALPFRELFGEDYDDRRVETADE